MNDINATEPGYDSNGTLEVLDAEAGVHRYTFKTMLPADADLSRTYSVGMQADRTFDGVSLSANPVFDLVPGRRHARDP